MFNLINLFHIIFVAPLLFYVGYNKDMVPNMVFNVLLATSFFVFLYHGYRLYSKAYAVEAFY